MVEAENFSDHPRTAAVETYVCGLLLAAYILALELNERLVASLYFGRGGRLFR